MKMDKKDFKINLQLISQQWEELKNDLYSGALEYNDLCRLINDYIFFNRFDNIFKETIGFFEVNLLDIKYMYRGVAEEININYCERMIPKIEFANGYNRMSPPGQVFLYLGILGKDRGKDFNTIKKHIVKTVLKETRAIDDTIVTICKFKINDSSKNKKVIDISGDNNIPTSEHALNQYIIKNASNKNSKSLDKQKLSEILANVYFNMFSSDQIFKPINTNEEETKKYEYGPFHAIANYIKEQGYAGIIYRSTVHQNGTNLVLFSTNDASLINNSMEHINTSNYL